MLDYEWTAGVNAAASVMLSADDPNCHEPPPSHGHPMVDHYADAAVNVNHVLPVQADAAGGSTLFAHHFSSQNHHHHQQQAIGQSNLLPFYDPRIYGASSYSSSGGGPSTFYHHDSFPGPGGDHFMAVPKTEDVMAQPPSAALGNFTARIGLNLGGRTYFSSAEDDFVSRLYRRSRPPEAGCGSVKAPQCQAEGCKADLTHAKHYHRRHKVCEFHSKASAVIAAGLTQRFCQQCSRFHLLSEFDHGKRSCRKRLADHNRRRRKSQQQQQPNLEMEIDRPPSQGGRSSLIDGMSSKSPQDSGNQSSSSVTIALSPPRMSLDCCFRQRSCYNQQHQAPSSSASSCSLFFSRGW
ncbi:hypothetical protein SAY86_021265 [Trapa natans]|uniref:SBP-type domain-containing protein n=1 Tax=Trapa natans TaxID=22666 RepID=A0AAN7RLG3_TRANT|nr:hypothetical protein SAY86_021265 [Trapa natans]